MIEKPATIVQTLVIAYGNPLRGDDGIGPAAAEIVDSWQLPNTKVLTVHQLVPELIDVMQDTGRVLFVDAGANTETPYQAVRIEPKKSRRLLGHYESPANVLALMYQLTGRVPTAWQLSIAAESFAHGEALSSKVRDNLRAALGWIRAFLAEPSCMKSA